MQNFTELYEVERRYEELAHRMSTPDAAASASVARNGRITACGQT